MMNVDFHILTHFDVLLFLSHLLDAEFIQHHTSRLDESPLSHVPFLGLSLISEVPRNRAPGAGASLHCPAVPRHPLAGEGCAGVRHADKATFWLLLQSRGKEGRPCSHSKCPLSSKQRWKYEGQPIKCPIFGLSACAFVAAPASYSPPTFTWHPPFLLAPSRDSHPLGRIRRAVLAWTSIRD